MSADRQAEVTRLTAEREWFKDRFPCDGVCVDAPEEACSRHGRNPADLWRIIGEVAAERNALAVAHARESEKVWKVEEVMDDIEGSDPTTWERLRDALAGSEADTSERETQHVMREPSMTDLRWTCSGCEWARSDAFTTAEERADSFATEHQPTDQEGK